MTKDYGKDTPLSYNKYLRVPDLIGLREWIEMMAGAGPLPYTLIKALGPRYRLELEAEVESAMDSLGDPDDAFRYHHSYLMAVGIRR